MGVLGGEGKVARTALGIKPRRDGDGLEDGRFAAAAFPNDAKAGSRFKAKMHIPYDQRPGKGVSDSQTPHFK